MLKWRAIGAKGDMEAEAYGEKYTLEKFVGFWRITVTSIEDGSESVIEEDLSKPEVLTSFAERWATEGRPHYTHAQMENSGYIPKSAFSLSDIVTRDGLRYIITKITWDLDKSSFVYEMQQLPENTLTLDESELLKSESPEATQ